MTENPASSDSVQFAGESVQNGVEPVQSGEMLAAPDDKHLHSSDKSIKSDSIINQSVDAPGKSDGMPLQSADESVNSDDKPLPSADESINSGNILVQSDDASGKSDDKPLQAADESSKGGSHLKFLVLIVIFVLALSAAAYVKTRRWANASYLESHLSIASQLAQLQIFSVIERELLLMEKLADSENLRVHMMLPDDTMFRKAAEQEIATYQFHLKEGDVYWSSAKDRVIRGLGSKTLSEVDPGNSESAWYDFTLSSGSPFHINTSRITKANGTMVYLNVPVLSFDRQPLGLVGSAIDIRNLNEMITGAFELIDRNFQYYIFDLNLRVVTSNADLAGSNNQSIIDIFPEIETDLTNLLRAAHSSNYIVQSGSSVFLLRRIPECDWFLAVFYPKPSIAAISPAVNEIFFSMLIICLLAVTAFSLYLRRLSQSGSSSGLRQKLGISLSIDKDIDSLYQGLTVPDDMAPLPPDNQPAAVDLFQPSSPLAAAFGEASSQPPPDIFPPSSLSLANENNETQERKTTKKTADAAESKMADGRSGAAEADMADYGDGAAEAKSANEAKATDDGGDAAGIEAKKAQDGADAMEAKTADEPMNADNFNEGAAAGLKTATLPSTPPKDRIKFLDYLKHLDAKLQPRDPGAPPSKPPPDGSAASPSKPPPPVSNVASELVESIPPASDKNDVLPAFKNKEDPTTPEN